MDLCDKNKIKRNIKRLFQRFELLQETLSVLNKAGIRYGIFCSGQVEAYTGYRQATDIDILVHNQDLKKLVNLFSENEQRPIGCACEYHIEDKKGNDIEIFCASDLEFKNKTYSIHLTELAYSKIDIFIVSETKVTFLNVADTIITKALLKRGVEQGKCDIEDILQLVKRISINRKYLIERMVETGTEDEVVPVLKGLSILKRKIDYSTGNKFTNAHL